MRVLISLATLLGCASIAFAKVPPTPLSPGVREGVSVGLHHAQHQDPANSSPVPAAKDGTTKRQADSAPQSAANWWMVKLTAALALIAFLQTIVFGIQAFQLRGTISKMDEIAQGQTADMQASIRESSRSAAAMESVARGIAVSARASTDSVAALRDRTAQQMRAYVTVVVGSAFFQDRPNNVRFQGVPTILNSGHTPAYKVSYRMRAAILPVTRPANFEYPQLPEQTAGESILGPQQSAALLDGGLVQDFVPDQDVEEIKDARSGRALCVWGIVTYTDIFGEPHETEFCQNLFWLPDGKVFGLYTPGHNNAN